MTRGLRIGIAGGGVAAGRHLRFLRRNAGITVAAVAEPDPARRSSVAATGLATVPSVEALFDRYAIDALFVCVPPFRHGKVEELALDHGTPMLIEKPIAADLDVAERLAARIAAAKVPVAVGYQWRQLSFLPRVRRYVESRPTNVVLATWLCPTPAAGWWGDRTLSTGQLHEQATHLVDLALQLVGPIAEVVGVGSARRVRGLENGFAKASVVAALFANGAAGSFVAACSLSEPYRRTLEIVGDGLAICVGDTDCIMTVDGRTTRLAHDGADVYERQHDAFFRLVRTNETDATLATYASALATHRTTLAMERSLAAGAGATIGVAAPVR